MNDTHVPKLNELCMLSLIEGAWLAQYLDWRPFRRWSMPLNKL